MIQLYFGLMGFHCAGGTIKGRRGTTDEDKTARIFMLFLGIVGFCWWNKAAMGLYMRCLRLSVSDAALVADAARVIDERVKEATEKRYAEQEERHNCWKEGYYEEREIMEADRRQLRRKVSDLEAAVRVLTGMVER